MLKDPLINKPDNLIWIKGIGIYQIIGGIFGLIVLFIGINGHFQNIINTFFLLAVFLFALSIYTGITCYKLKDSCLNVTIINQALQVFSLFAGQYVFQYVSGISVSASLDFSDGFDFGFYFHISNINLAIENNEGKYFLGINFIAIYIIYKIESLKKEMKEKKDIKERLHKYNQ